MKGSHRTAVPNFIITCNHNITNFRKLTGDQAIEHMSACIETFCGYQRLLALESRTINI